MFERFTHRARESVVLAQDEARHLRHGYIGTEHLLLGILRQDTGVGARTLQRLGVTLEGIRSDVLRLLEAPGLGIGAGEDEGDAEALQTIGIDLEEVRRRVEEAFGPGALDRKRRGRPRGRRGSRCETAFGGRIPFTPRAKKALELSLREAVRMGDHHIGTEHLLLGLVREGEGVAVRLLSARGASATRIRSTIAEEAGRGRDLPGRSA